MKRARLSTRDRVECFESAGGVCHFCDVKIKVGERWEVSHEIALELGGEDAPSNRKPAHYACHRTYTAQVDQPNIARAKRREARHIGARAPSRNPMPGGRASNWKRKVSGEVVRRDV